MSHRVQGATGGVRREERAVATGSHDTAWSMRSHVAAVLSCATSFSRGRVRANYGDIIVAFAPVDLREPLPLRLADERELLHGLGCANGFHVLRLEVSPCLVVGQGLVIQRRLV